MEEELKLAFEQFRNGSELFLNRTRQINEFRPIAREILAQLVAKGSVTNEDLTGLIHLFRPKPVGELANKYLAHLVADKSKAKELSEQLQATGLGGYTAPGRLKIHDLTTEQLRDVHALLSDAFNVTTAAEASQVCATYDRKKVPYVTPGIYSPWLHYIQPELFPILNDATKAFFKAQGLPVEYPALITRVPELSQAMGVKDLGLLDAFAWGQQDDQASDPKGGKWRSANWIKKISRADWELFFDACNEVIEHFGMDASSPLLAMNIHPVATQGVLMNLSNRACFAMHIDDDVNVMLMLPKGSTKRLLVKDEILSTFMFSGPANAEGTRVTPATLRDKQNALLPVVIEAAEELLGRSQSSPYRKHHIPDLYRMTTEPDFREKALDYLLEGKGEWPGATASREIKYWVFQANPKSYDSVGALRDNAVDRWTVNAHKKAIHAGDKVILWNTGSASGCYALATVTTEVLPMPPEGTKYSLEGSFSGVQDRVGLVIDHNLWDRPILWESIKDEGLDLKAGSQGTNFAATKQQYNTLLHLTTGGTFHKHKPKTMDLNTILYGPPGTGKTYATVDHAMAIIENRSVAQYAKEERTELRGRFESMVKAGRIQFTTFHQSFSYEDFIEGIKPETDDETNLVSYAVRPGVFKRIAVEAAYDFVAPVADKTKVDVAFDELFERYTNQVEEALTAKEQVIIPTRSGKKLEVIDISDHGNLLLKHVNSSTTRTYVISLNRSRALNAAFPDLDALENIDRDFRTVIGGSNGTAYWAVLNQIRSLPKEKKKEQTPTTVALLFEDKLPIVERIDWANRALRSIKAKPYVLVIDEINRGNIAAIFGELITLIEPDKRALGAEAASASLPYSKKPFSVPPNLHILGTMNTADRSVEALDTALRRRFSFVEMPSKPELIEQPEGLLVDLRRLLTTMNARIEQLLDKDHHIGHSYFMGIAEAEDPEAELKRVFKNKVLPLLEEYFYGDAVKVGMVLGKAFVPQPEKKKGTPFAEGYRSEEVETKPIYRINDPETLSLADFASIYA